MTNPVLVEVTRGDLVESMHRGAVSVVDAQGRVLLALGEQDRPVFPRSAVKALQALPLIESGAADRFKLTDAEIALACASHGGEPDHAATAAAMLAKAGRDGGCLECGAHWPMYEPAARSLAASGQAPSALHNNCSGKHAGFVCLACEIGEDPAGYVTPGHKVQAILRDVLTEVTGAAHSMDMAGTDGCSIPTYAVPLPAMALGFARFGTGEGFGPERAKAAIRIRAAVAAAPFHVAGTARFDTQVMERLGARAFVKVGAEGVHCASLPEAGLGIAIKCDDGNTRASQAILAALIARFIPLEPADSAFINDLEDGLLTNWNGMKVGRVRATDALRP